MPRLVEEDEEGRIVFGDCDDAAMYPRLDLYAVPETWGKNGVGAASPGVDPRQDRLIAPCFSDREAYALMGNDRLQRS